MLGVAGAKIWTRPLAKLKRHRHKRRLEDKESMRWIEAAQTAAQRLAAAAAIVMVGDRENDIYQGFTRRPPNVDLITRARSDRKLLDGGLLYETVNGFPRARNRGGGRPRPAARARRGRVARVAVSFGKATIAKPKTGRACADPKSCEISVVVAREIGAPAGAKPLVWRLLTTLPVETAEDALEVIRLYRLRWRIEEVFRVLKRDGLALEQTQVETARSMFNLAALAVVAAARIIQLTDARDAGVRPASDVIDEGLIAATAAIGETLEGKTAPQKNPHPRGSLSWLAWITARLGGWHGYYRPPGPKTMADGWRRLAAMLDGYAIAHGKSLGESRRRMKGRRGLGDPGPLSLPNSGPITAAFHAESACHSLQTKGRRKRVTRGTLALVRPAYFSVKSLISDLAIRSSSKIHGSSSLFRQRSEA